MDKTDTELGLQCRRQSKEKESSITSSRSHFRRSECVHAVCFAGKDALVWILKVC